jgi:hypothetical protein
MQISAARSISAHHEMSKIIQIKELFADNQIY